MTKNKKDYNQEENNSFRISNGFSLLLLCEFVIVVVIINRLQKKGKRLHPMTYTVSMMTFLIDQKTIL